MAKRLDVDWQALRDLVSKGITLREIAETFGIKYGTLCTRSYRERWNTMALRANLPPRSKTERKDARPELLELKAIRNGVLLPLVKLANFYQSADLQTLRKDQARFLSFAATAIKVLTLNDAKQGEGNAPIVNLTLLAARPAELIASQARDVTSSTVPDSKSSEAGAAAEGNPVDSSSVRQIPATDSA